MIKDTIQHVQECLPCQKKKINRRLDIEQEINKLEKVQKEISIDYIIKLSKSRKKNSILVIKN